ncbi:MAG: hypothetical protein AAFQ51_06915, partial [Pseudomonadota bacterium]
MRAARVTIQTVGPFRVDNALGRDLTPTAKKNRALLAMLATAPDFRRSDAWLTSRLWSKAESETKAGKSLRQAILTTRKALDDTGILLRREKGTVSLNPDLVDVDHREILRKAPSPDLFEGGAPEFLEGLVIDDPEFEAWLRSMRTSLDDYFAQFIGDAADPSEPLISATAVAPAQRTEQLRRDREQAIAILPLRNRTDNSMLDYAGQGISEDLSDRVGRLRWLPVIARGAANRFEEVGENGASISAQLNARYLLDGDLEDADGGYAIRLRLHNGTASRVMWSERYTLPRDMPRERLMTIIPEMVSNIDTRVDLAEQDLVAGREPRNDAFYDHIWRGRWHLSKITRADAEQAKRHFDAALGLEGDAPEALIQAGWWHLWHIWATRGPMEQLDDVAGFAKRAIFGDERDGRAHCLLGLTETWRLNSETAISLLKESIELNPSSSHALQHLGTAYYLDGTPDRSIAPLTRALELSPGEPLEFLTFAELGMAHLMLGEHEKALENARAALAHRGRYWYAQIIRL